MRVQYPRSDHTAAPPDLRDSSKIEIVSIVVRIAQRGCLGINCLLPLANIGVTKHAQPLSVGGHDSVFDSIVNHLDEVAGPIGSAVQVAELRCVFELLAPGSAWNVPYPRCQRGEDRIQMFYDRSFAANHHTITALQTPDTAACSHVDIVNFLRPEFLGAPDIIDVVRVPTINEDVAGLH